MAENQKIARFSSCRGVAFEINPNKDNPFSIPSQDHPKNINGWAWLPWTQRSSFKVFPISNNSSIQRSLSRPSSHFCDLDLDNQEEDEEKQSTIVIPVTKHPPPKKPSSRLSIILLDQGLFTVYKRLFLLSFTLNTIALTLAATNHFTYAKSNPTLFSIANILALTLCRSEVFLRLLFWLAVTLLGRSWVPLALKTATTSFLQSLGGIHSGCGVSAVAWLVYSLVLTVKDRNNTSPEIIAIASTILSLIFISSLAAFPLVRHLHHNVFERTHRFAGWTALALLWAFIILTSCYNPTQKSYNFKASHDLVSKQEFWFTLVISIVIILPWVTMTRVPIKITSSPSGHASIIKFDGGVRPGLLGRISPAPLSEWHAFGIISDGKNEHMMLAGAVGDFTKSLVSDPPRHIWVRRVKFAGLPYLVNMYERVVLVATGSGVCVFLSFVLQRCNAEVCLVWVAKGVEENFGGEIKEMVSRLPEGKVVVHDTAVMGRPDVGQMSVEAAKRWRAEVVIVTSNPEGSRDVVAACNASGIAAFGPIWDS